MPEVVAINGSSSMGKGETAKVLAPFLTGLEEGGASTKLVYSSQLNVRPCVGDMGCWYRTPGKCHQRDAMQELYPSLMGANILVIATPVYVPLPGELQNMINRLVPLMDPDLHKVDGRTRGRRRDGVNLDKVVLVATGAWWERQNFDNVTSIARDLAANLGVGFAGALVRPHAFILGQDPEASKVIFSEIREAGRQLAVEGRISQELMDSIARPLLSEEELRDNFNSMNAKAKSR